MEQALAFGAIVPAAVGAGCCAAGRRSTWGVLGAMMLMVVAIGDTMLLAESLLPPFFWAGLLTVASIGLALTHCGDPRREASHSCGADDATARRHGTGPRPGVGAVTTTHARHHHQAGEVGVAAAFPALIAFPGAHVHLLEHHPDRSVLDLLAERRP